MSDLEDKFEYPVLTKTFGNLNYHSLKEIKDQVKANAASIYSDLGGGTNGHLGLVLSPTEYALVSATPYVRHVHPGNLVIPAGTAQHAANRLRDDHKEQRRLFKEMIDLEKLLQKQLVQAIPSQYLKQFRSRHSNAIDQQLPTIFASLFSAYGTIPEEELEDHKEKLRNKVFSITDPIVVLFNEVEDLQEMATAANAPLTPAQTINLGLKLIKNMNDFEKALTDWYALTAVNKTWPNFKNHFTAAQDTLRQLRGPTMQSGFLNAQVNSATQTIMEAINHDRTEYLNAMSETEDRLLKAFEITSTASTVASTITPDPVLPTPTINASQSDVVQLEILKLLKELKDDMIKTNKPRTTQQQYGRKNTSKYCWSHGACSHAGKDCKNPKDGHKKEATFANRMGGSDRFCT